MVNKYASVIPQPHGTSLQTPCVPACVCVRGRATMRCADITVQKLQTTAAVSSLQQHTHSTQSATPCWQVA